jgi:hypothetical protein
VIKIEESVEFVIPRPSLWLVLHPGLPDGCMSGQRMVRGLELEYEEEKIQLVCSMPLKIRI